ncbi:MAG: leucine-rich repeat domain-containing protein [Muribaculaceae bacterium]|nr:leucine-rich repeat domain-containing protein [Muribaculaceae bacterium]
MPIFSQDFEYTYEGQILTYNITSKVDKTCQVRSDKFLSGSVVIPATASYGGDAYTVTAISTYAFAGSVDLKEVIIPNTVATIGDCAFYYCHALNSVVIPNSVIHIGMQAFYGCEELTELMLPSSLKSIGYMAFSYCIGLTEVTIPKSVTTIVENPFAGCFWLTTINVEADNEAFTAVDGLLYSKDMTELIAFPNVRSSVDIPASVTTIGDDAFRDSWALTEVTIPSTVTSIGSGAFTYCNHLASVTIPNSITRIGYMTFFDCAELTDVSIPNSVTEIGEFAFYYCSRLTELSIPSSVTVIGDNAFRGCRGVTSVTIPASVAYIGQEAFVACDNLNSVYYAATEPISGSDDIFEVYATATLYVPEEAVAKCKTIDPWKNFAKIEAHDFAGVEELPTYIDDEKACEVYDLNGVRIANTTDNLAPGLYIVRQGPTAKKIAVI